MGLLSRIIDFIKNNKVTDKKSRYIFYKIVDLRNEESKLILQCIKTSAFYIGVFAGYAAMKKMNMPKSR